MFMIFKSLSSNDETSHVALYNLFLVHTIILRSGHILDSIQVNDQHFGASKDRGPDITTINLAYGEKVTSIQYNLAKNGFSYCNFIIYTSKFIRPYGPYAIKDNYAYCNKNSPITRRYISNGAFLEYMQQYSQLNPDGQIQLKWT